ncbi:hypothetical protein FREDWARD_92 [Mycobacterium phage Fredward]|nr:hypothetical protein V424_gp022 [Mycobacterium phage Fredward]AGY37033.1 hypothetical protein FREDWARD_92 [Mycobacterium phage Fredward]QXN73061.1 hypothetical protein SEA_PHILLIS_90 [Mycobacterium phage Phillis]
MYEVWARDANGSDCYIVGELSYSVAMRIADNITRLAADVRAWIEEI